MPNIQIVPGSGVYGVKRERFQKHTNDYYIQKNQEVETKMFINYKDMLAHKNSDSVVIASPDYWHAFMAINACKAKKNIYLEKPFTFTIKEGLLLNKAVRYNGAAILAV